MFYGRCFLCSKWGYLEEHHIFGGANRKKSEKFGLKVGLCGVGCHRDGPKAVHQCGETAQKLHEYGQWKYMREHHATVDDFRSLFGKNYLDEPYELGGIAMIDQARGLLHELQSTGRLEDHEYSLIWAALNEAAGKINVQAERDVEHENNTERCETSFRA